MAEELPVLGHDPDPVSFYRVASAHKSVETTKVIERVGTALPLTVGELEFSRLGSPETLVVVLERLRAMDRVYAWLLKEWYVTGTTLMPDEGEELVYGDGRFRWGPGELGYDNPYYRRVETIVDEYRGRDERGA